MAVSTFKYDKDGYKPLIDYDNWRVATLNSSINQRKDSIKFIERHLKTDEVFVLLKGTAYLIHAGNKKNPDRKLKTIKMKKEIFYNVKKATWHTAILKKNTKILIVENKNTSRGNSEYIKLIKK